MSIASRIEAIEQHLTDDYDVLTLAGADLTNVDKNIVNLKPTWKERLLYFMNNGTDVVWENWDKVVGEGTSLTLNNTLEGKMSIVLKGNTSQATTTGKNRLNVPSNLSITGSTSIKTLIENIPAGNYVLNCGNVSKGGSNYPVLTINNSPTILATNQNVSITIPSTVDNAYFYSNGYNYSASQGITSTVENLMISTSGGAYEPYTGGIASPNPDYPQEIHTVKGDNTISICGKNLLSVPLEQPRSNILTCNIPNFKAGTYTFSVSATENASQITARKIVSGTTTQLTPKYNAKALTFTLDEDCTLQLEIYRVGILPSEVSNIMLEKGNQATSYMQYKSSSYEIDLPVENLINYLDVKGVGSRDGTENIITDSTSISENILTINHSYGQGGAILKFNTITPPSLKTGEYITISFIPTSLNGNIVVGIGNYNGGGTNNIQSGISTAVVDKKFSITLDAKSDYTKLGIFIQGQTNALSIKDLQIEKGKKTNSYTPYGTTPIELCKIGTYQDKIFKNTPNTTDYDSNLEDNVWYVKKEIGKVVLDGSENWAIANTGTTNWYYYASSSNIPAKNIISASDGYCTYYTPANIGNNTTNQGILLLTSGVLRVRYGTEDTKANWETWLSTNKPVLYYPVANPTYTLIEDRKSVV